MNYFEQLADVKSKEIFPGFIGRFIHTNNITIAFWEAKAGSVVAEHSHVNEQIVTVREGLFELTVDSVSQVMDAGCVAVIPPNVRHGGKAITDCKLLDVFSPVRDDYRI